MKQKKYIALIILSTLILNLIIVYYGRIYFPDNFHPSEVTFFENYWVLTLGIILGISEIIFFLGILYLLFFKLIPDVIEDYKNL